MSDHAILGLLLVVSIAFGVAGLLVLGLVRRVGTVGQELTRHLLADLEGRDVARNELGTDRRSGKQAG